MTAVLPSNQPRSRRTGKEGLTYHLLFPSNKRNDLIFVLLFRFGRATGREGVCVCDRARCRQARGHHSCRPVYLSPRPSVCLSPPPSRARPPVCLVFSAVAAAFSISNNPAERGARAHARTPMVQTQITLDTAAEQLPIATGVAAPIEKKIRGHPKTAQNNPPPPQHHPSTNHHRERGIYK